jgi:pimeloyl-ACP methyl ester carboxylesterase
VPSGVFTRATGEPDAPAVTWLHGFPLSSWDWAKLHDALGPGRRDITLDFLGFGASSRPAAMSAAPEGAAPLVRAPEAARQIAAAADYLRRERGIARLHLVAHSWGTIPAGFYAAAHPAGLASLTLFGPVVPVAGAQDDAAVASWWTISAEERFEQLRFADVLPRGLDLLEPAVVRRWANEFAASEPGGDRSTARPLRIPAGPLADAGAAQAGRYPYAASEVRAPVLVVYGDYDTVVDDAGAAAFLDRFTASPLKWRLRIDHGTHVLHLERGRRSLYESVAAFIRAAAAPAQ